MRVSVVCTDEQHPIWPKLYDWAEAQTKTQGAEAWQTVELVRKLSDSRLDGGDILFLVSCHEIVKPDLRAKYRHVLVLHASDLPRGRGWSPYVWAIVNGDDHITVCLLDAADPVDSGAVWKRETIDLTGNETHDEINAKLFDAELKLMSWAIENCDKTTPKPQEGEPTYLRRRTPADSELDPYHSIVEQFDLMRVCDPERYPAWFEHRGRRYKVTLSAA